LDFQAAVIRAVEVAIRAGVVIRAAEVEDIPMAGVEDTRTAGAEDIRVVAAVRLP
jgi:hypothetical protein